MRKYLIVLASFVIMLCLGGVYAWSIIASELMGEYNITAAQSQAIFGTLIAVFPITMIFAGQLAKKIRIPFLGYISGLLFLLGYMLASYSSGNYFVILLGIGVLAGIGTGFGYWVSLTIPVQWFPEKKGLITGITAAGFGLGAVLMSSITEKVLDSGYDILQLLKGVGILYGLVILLFSNMICPVSPISSRKKIKISDFIISPIFIKLFLGIFLGTFAGLLIIGSLKIIGEQSDIQSHILVVGVSLFAVANFLGRLFWGYVSDKSGASINIFLALLVQSIAILLLAIITISGFSFVLVSILIGFGFGGNFVLFAKESAHVFGIRNLGFVYPYVFLGYAIAGIAGPFTGGIMFDYSGTFKYAIYLASFMSFIGSVLYLFHYMHENVKHDKSTI